MTVINTNVSALYAQGSISQNTRAMQQTMTQLSTGKRINDAADDSAGLSIAAHLTSQVRGLNQAIRNANDAVSMIQTAEGATDTITNMLQRMRELAIQAGNDTNSGDDKNAVGKEYDALTKEITRVANTTTWNGFSVLDGQHSQFHFVLDASASTNGILDVKFNTMKLGSGIMVASADLGSALLASGTNAVVLKIDDSIKYVNEARSEFGAAINRLQYTVDNLTNISTNTAASRSRVEDVDYSIATSDLAKRNIIQQAASAMLAQANQQPQAVLQLLK